jgi:Domain of unknown function (DUF1833)
MPTYLPPRLGISLSEALAESYTVAPVDDPVLLTLEFHHPDFEDEEGRHTAFRIVNDWADLRARLEPGAPLDGGQLVTFKACPFRYVKPEQTDTGAPAAISLEVENVSREVSMLLDLAVDSMQPVLMIERVYLPSDTSGPHEMPPTRMYLSAPQVSAGSVVTTASFGTLTNRKFPGKRYTREVYPGLTAK